MLSMDGFETFRLDREKGKIAKNNGKTKRGGGLIIYVKKDLSAYTKILDQVSSISSDLEQLWICIDKPNVSTKIIANVYRPPNSKLAEGIEKLSDSVSKALDLVNGELVIVGDFNVNYNTRNTPAFKLLKSFEREFHLTQLINTSTRHGNKSSTCLDLVFTNMDHIASSGTLNIEISDHLPVFVVKKKQNIISATSFIKARSFIKYDKQAFQEEVRYHPDWGKFWGLENNKPEKMWEIMLEIITEKADSHCPFREMKIREDTPQWITQEILSEINHKDYLYVRAKKLNDTQSWDVFRKIEK